MQDGVPAWVQVAAGNIADLIDAGSDPLTEYLLADGTRTLTGDLAVTATKLVDTLDLSLHNHDGSAGMGVSVSNGSPSCQALSIHA